MRSANYDPRDWTNPPQDLLLEIAPGVGRREGLERALREAIRAGRIGAGTRLPPSRQLAHDLGLSRGTVVEAYSQLVAEGFLTARQGSGTVVAPVVLPSPSVAAAAAGEQATPRFDFHPGQPDLSSFPADRWVRSLRRALRTAPPVSLGYRDSRGAPELRAVLSSYLARARGVTTSPAELVTCAGFLRGLSLVCEALRRGGARTIAVEEPCVPLHRETARAAGLELMPLEVDEQGVQVEALDAARPDAVLVTPAHQFPLGSTLSPARRAALVEWARKTDGFVIEDDYDGEFRYDRQPVGALQALDPDRVVYVGTASKTLTPGLRIAWLALPPRLVEPVVEIKRLSDRQLPFTDELALTELIESGDWDRHLRRMRARYRSRRDALLAMLPRRAPDVRPGGISAGLHVVLELPEAGPGEEELVRRAAERSMRLFALRPLWQQPQGRPDGLVVGYGSPPEHRFAAALRALGNLLAEAR